MEKDHKILHFIALLAAAGFGISVYLMWLHLQPDYSHSLLPCDLNDVFSCSTVNKSKYGYFLGIPISIFGAIGYALMGFLALFHFKHHKPLLTIVVGLGFLYSLYLTAIEAFVLHAYCYYCLAQFAIITVMFALCLWKFGKETISFIRSIEFVD